MNSSAASEHLSEAAAGGRPWSQLLRRAGIYILLLIGSFLVLMPVFWMLSSSLKYQGEILVSPPKWLPDPPRWGNYREALTTLPFGLYFLNTLKIEIGVILGALISDTLPAYSFARLRWPGRDVVFFILLSVLMLPAFVTMVPLFVMWSKIGLTNTFWPLILPAWFGNPYYIFLVRQFMLTLPVELEDAALIDGASFFRTFVSIILPQVKPALAVLVIAAFMNVWNDFIHPLIYLSNPKNYTVALGLSAFLDAYNSRWDLLMAASAVTVLPVVLVFFFFQRYFVEGVALTGIKG